MQNKRRHMLFLEKVDIAWIEKERIVLKVKPVKLVRYAGKVENFRLILISQFQTVTNV